MRQAFDGNATHLFPTEHASNPASIEMNEARALLLNRGQGPAIIAPDPIGQKAQDKNDDGRDYETDATHGGKIARYRGLDDFGLFTE